MSEEIFVTDKTKIKSLRSLTQVVYVLYALSYFTGITAIIGIIINYIKKEEVAGTWLESHFRWQIPHFLVRLAVGNHRCIDLIYIDRFCHIICQLLLDYLSHCQRLAQP
jgi:uncharacterized membrane protein